MEVLDFDLEILESLLPEDLLEIQTDYPMVPVSADTVSNVELAQGVNMFPQHDAQLRSDPPCPQHSSYSGNSSFGFQGVDFSGLRKNQSGVVGPTSLTILPGVEPGVVPLPLVDCSPQNIHPMKMGKRRRVRVPASPPATSELSAHANDHAALRPSLPFAPPSKKPKLYEMENDSDPRVKNAKTAKKNRDKKKQELVDAQLKAAELELENRELKGKLRNAIAMLKERDGKIEDLAARVAENARPNSVQTGAAAPARQQIKMFPAYFNPTKTLVSGTQVNVALSRRLNNMVMPPVDVLRRYGLPLNPENDSGQRLVTTTTTTDDDMTE